MPAGRFRVLKQQKKTPPKKAGRKPLPPEITAGLEAGKIHVKHGPAAAHRFLARQNTHAPVPAGARGPVGPRQIPRGTSGRSGVLPYKPGTRPVRQASVIGNPGFVSRFVSDLGAAAYSAPGLPIVVAKAKYKDLQQLNREYTHGQYGKAALTGLLGGRATRELAKQMGVSTAKSFTPQQIKKHPGIFALNVAAVASLGAGAAARGGAASAALREGAGVRAAVSRQGFEGGSLMHRPPPGTIDLPGGAQALEHDNPLLTAFKRARMKRVVKAVETGRKTLPERLLPAQLAKEFTPQAIIGRENRAREIVRADVSGAPRIALARQSKPLTAAEHTATRTVMIEGRHALRHPEETIARHVAKHESIANKLEADAAKIQAKIDYVGKRGGRKYKTPQQFARAKERVAQRLNLATHNREIAKDIGKALPVLKNPRPEFMNALQASRNFQRAQERTLIRNPEVGLTGRGAYTSRATAAEFYGRPKGVAPKGSVYFPTGEQFAYPTRGVKGGAVSRVASKFGVGKGQSSSYLMGTTRRRTGEGMARGVTTRPIEAQVTRATGVSRLESVNRSYQTLLSLSKPRKTSEFDVPIRRGGITLEQRQRVASEAEQASHGDQAALGRLHELLKPGPGEGQRWVDSRYIKEFATSAHGIPVFGAINTPFRFGGVYFRPAYVLTNRPQNFVMRHLAQNLGRSPGKIGGSVKAMRTEIGVDNAAFYDALGGEARTHSFLPTRGAGQFERKTTQYIMDKTDTNERFLAVAARAHENGIQTTADISRLRSDYFREDPKAVNLVVKIGRQARKDLVDFATTPGERTLSDIIYFYPWLSRGSVWAGRFVAEHPARAALLAQGGQEMKRERIGAMGPIPTWMKGMLNTRYGVTNLNPVNTFATPAQIVDSLRNPATARSVGQEFGTPAVQALTTEPKQIPQRMIASIAGLSALQRAGIIGKPSKTFPKTGLGPALGPLVFGGPWPKPANWPYVRKQALAELTPTQRQAVTAASQNVHLQNLVKKGLLPRNQVSDYRDALDAYNQRNTIYSKLDQSEPKGHSRELKKMQALLGVLSKSGFITAKKAKDEQHYYATTALSADALQKDRDWYWSKYASAGAMVKWYRDKTGAS